MKNKIINIINKLLKRRITIKYNLSNNFTRCYNEAYGIASHRNKYLKNPRSKIHSYTYYGFIYLWLAIVYNLLTCLLYKLIGYNTFICFLCCLMHIINFIVVLYFIYYLLRLMISKQRKIKGSFILDKKGLIDSTFKGIKILFEWSKIKVVIVGKHSITILTDTPIYFFVNRDLESTLIPALKTYKKNLLIIKNQKVI